MKPIMLTGHTRALTKIKYNLEGDLLFSVSKDQVASVWFTQNGERLGTFNGHNGSIWCCDVRYDSSLLLTGSADNSCKLWDVRTGVEKATIVTKSAVRTCGWSYSGDQFFISTDKAMGQLSELRVFSLADVRSQGKDVQPYLTISAAESKITSAVWGPVDETIITGHEKGDIIKWDAKTGKELRRTREHKLPVNDIQLNKDQTMFITASKDCTSKLFDAENFTVQKQYKTERPVNSAAISPLKEHVLVGGGQEAMSVTTTAGKVGKFDARFYHMVFEEELGRVKGHFGPINTVSFSPDGKGYASGGEDGFVRLHNFDQSYFEFEFEH